MSTKMDYDRAVIENMSREERTRYDEIVPQRIIRFAEITPNWRLSPNCLLPGHERANIVYVGGGYFERGVHRPIVPAEHYSCAILQCGPGKGAALHAHTTEEMFMALSGRWVVYWGSEGEHHAVLDTWDAVSFPAPVFRGYRNAGTETACLLAIIGGGDPPKPVDHPDITAAIAEFATAYASGAIPSLFTARGTAPECCGEMTEGAS